MALLIDSSVFIAAERNGYPPARAIALLGADAVSISSVTAAEMLAGVYRADSRARRLGREAFVETIIEAVTVIPFDLHVARVHAEVTASLAAVGRPIGAHDLLIAATALAYGYTVLTDNLRDFQRVP